jgi:ubiquinone biosynthesis protein UbiJ
LIKLILISVIEKAMNSVLALHSGKHQILEIHAGKALHINFKDLNMDLFLIVHPEKIYVHSVFPDTPDTMVSGSIINFLKQLKTDSLSPDINVEGDVDLAHDIMRLFKTIDINWEEYSAFFIGDLPTHHFSNFVRQCKKTVRHISSRSIEDAVDFIQEEQRFLPTNEEVEDFYEDIRELRNNIDRLEARLNRLMENNRNENI